MGISLVQLHPVLMVMFRKVLTLQSGMSSITTSLLSNLSHMKATGILFFICLHKKPPAHSTPGLLHTTSVIVSVIHADTEDGWYLCLTWYPPLHSVELYLPGTVGSHKGVGEGQEEGSIKEGANLDY